MAFEFDSRKLKEFLTFRKKGEQPSNEPELMTASTGKYEINLVPDVKMEMIRTQKVRNLVLFATIVVVSVSVGVVAILGGVKAGQDLTMSGQDQQLKERSNQVVNFTELSDLLTVQDQLNKISEIEGNKKVLSRVFGLLSVLLPSGDDRISLSELSIDLETTTMNFDAQADAGVEPLIDYRVLESFKKSVALMKYDYGRYVTADGTEIPTRCIEETDSNGNMYTDEKTGAIYAVWKRDKEECRVAEEDAEIEEELKEETEAESSTTTSTVRNKTVASEQAKKKAEEEKAKKREEFTKERKIWRTPQFEEWYKKEYMGLDGSISDVEHFESQCIQYSGTEEKEKVVWTADNECYLAPDGVVVSDSANGRDSSGNLVLRFGASVTIDEGYFAYNNKHVMGIGPFGQNVTDSYVQTEGMFVAPARDCEYGDTTCLNDTTNSTGE